MFNKIPIDKLLHFLVCFIIALVAWLYSGAVLPDRPIVYAVIIRSLIAFAVTAIFAIGKELYDRKQNGNHFCRKDLLWDGLGAVLGCNVGLIHLLIS